MGLNETQQGNHFGGKSYVPPAPLQQNYHTYQSNYTNPPPGNPLTATGSFVSNHNNLTSF
jgi:phosphatidylethanolamine-binding protein (PEBP) family uncharacterized protein